MALGPGTDYQRPSDHRNCHLLHSSASSRRTCSTSRQCWLQCWCFVPSSWCCCDCTASFAPDSTRLDCLSVIHHSSIKHCDAVLSRWKSNGLLTVDSSASVSDEWAFSILNPANWEFYDMLNWLPWILPYATIQPRFPHFLAAKNLQPWSCVSSCIWVVFCVTVYMAHTLCDCRYWFRRSVEVCWTIYKG